MRRPLLPAALLLLAVALATGCSDRTQIMVEVDSDLPVPAELDGIRVEAMGTQTTMASGSLGTRGLPRTVGLVPGDDPPAMITVRAIGTRGGTDVVERVAITSFVEGRTLRLPMFLSRDCIGVACGDGETCDMGTCVDAFVDPGDLDEWVDRDSGTPPPRDAGMDRMDAGPTDAGPPPPDAGPRDGGGVDSGPAPVDGGPPPPDAGLDGGPPPADAGTDAGPPPVDAGTDGGPPPVDAGTDAGALPSCDTLYGSALDYQLCAERAGECEFYSTLEGNSCDDVCSSGGGTCVETYRPSTGNLCNRTGSARACSASRTDEICICSR